MHRSWADRPASPPRFILTRIARIGPDGADVGQLDLDAAPRGATALADERIDKDSNAVAIVRITAANPIRRRVPTHFQRPTSAAPAPTVAPSNELA